MILDDFVLRDFVLNLSLVLAAMLMLSLVFTVFELLGDILRNQVSPWIVGEYLLNVTPYFLYNSAQYGVLLAGLITLGMMPRDNEVTALKATGLSIYPIVIPVLGAALL